MPNTNCLENIQCPRCKQEDRFHIAASVLVEVTDDGTEDMCGDYEWSHSSFCCCPECEHIGTLKDFYINK